MRYNLGNAICTSEPDVKYGVWMQAALPLTLVYFGSSYLVVTLRFLVDANCKDSAHRVTPDYTSTYILRRKKVCERASAHGNAGHS